MTFTSSIRLVFLAALAATVVGACGSSDDGSGAQPATSATCGNGALDTGEACDGTNLGGKTCASITAGAKPNGTPLCNNCVLSDSTCSGTGSGSGGSSQGGRTGTGGGPTQGSGGSRSTIDAG